MFAEAPIRWFARRPRALPRPAPTIRFDPAEFAPALQTRLLILQATPFCNIDCDYCYLPERDSTARMSIATVRRAAERLLEDDLARDEITVVWHAGEPLAMPRAFYAAAFSVLEQVLGSTCRVAHSIQTNGTLIDDAWCELFKRHHVQIGVSVDGPAALHDRHRRTRGGHGTHARVVAGMQRLRAHGIAFHAIAVVTADTFADAHGFVDFFVEQGVAEVGCNYDEAEGVHARSSLAGREAAHAAFVQHLLDRSLASDPPLRIRELGLALDLIRAPLPRVRWQGRAWPDNAQAQPFALITVGHDGRFGTFSPELLGQRAAEFGDFVLGNVRTDGYLASARSACFERLWSAIVHGTRACEAACAHFGFCGGGAPANKFYENSDFASAETLYCRTMFKRPFDAVLSRLEGAREAPEVRP
ncbi:cyclophane-forming radical SAM/SPASM peptide maturase GrrM/OscB [Piscinibacter koreensis]|uniref:GRRM system radical SAM/SPASM domain protein n=1 Tax=Piscinibacter koreensis TaxID=2742824 RepID=A0A7Y6TUW8_9BURK|nr:cyclophane-forming radical SAM/SPASM peptide maturase GrrM/OscB [Schlegelella koreensis]NUZ04474.1 GRRM system radical SAM/SPASM domain protein [Schlegelella koreensis]